MGLLDELGSGLKGVVGQVLGGTAGSGEANALPALLSQVLGKTDIGSVGGSLPSSRKAALAARLLPGSATAPISTLVRINCVLRSAMTGSSRLRMRLDCRPTRSWLPCPGIFREPSIR